MAFETLLKFAQSAGISLRENEPLCDHTTFRIGGPARWFAQPETVEQMIDLLAFVKAHHLSCAVVGKGSNLLVPDDGYNGLVIRTAEGVPCWHEDGCTVTVPSVPLEVNTPLLSTVPMFSSLSVHSTLSGTSTFVPTASEPSALICTLLPGV